MSAIGGIYITINEVMTANDQLFKMAYYEINLNVLREGRVLNISSLDIVPGDVVFVDQAIKIPFEGVLLEGELLINECALTGESVPVMKKGEDVEKYRKMEHLSKGCYLYEGTTIVQINCKKTMKVW